MSLARKLIESANPEDFSDTESVTNIVDAMMIEQPWAKHRQSVKELETVLDEMGVKYQNKGKRNGS